MSDKKDARLIPPYCSYKTLRNFIEPFKITMPGRIDRTIMKNYSGAQQAQLLNALKSLGLIASDGVPKPQLHRWVKADGEERQKVLKEILVAAYPFIFSDGFDLTTATPGSFDQRFAQTGITGDTIRKCVVFFIAAAQAAGIQLSPYIKPVKARASSVRTRRQGASGQQKNNTTAAQQNVSQQSQWSEMLLAKFPAFDPAWPDDVKSKWFDGFQKLMKSGPAEAGSAADDDHEEE